MIFDNTKSTKDFANSKQAKAIIDNIPKGNEFGEVYTDLSDPEKLINTLYYIIGETAEGLKMKTYDVTVKSRCTAKSEYFKIAASNFEIAKKRAREKATANGWNAHNSNLMINSQNYYDAGRFAKHNTIALW